MRRAVAITHLLSVALLAVACERPTAPVTLVYADRPVTVSAASRGWKAVTVGASHTCGIRTDGALYCWGDNNSGELGIATTRGKCGRRLLPCEAAPRAVMASLRFDRVSAGQRHTCAISTDRALYCWGDSYQFQTGIEGELIVPLPRPVRPDLQFIDVSSGATHTCAVRTNGVAYCWGEGFLGTLGRGDTLSSVFPAPVSSSARFTSVHSGRLRTCGIELDGGASCWGAEWESASNGFDFFHTRTTPHRIAGLEDLVDISASTTSLCALRRSGVALCWEGNSFAQLGLGNLDGTATPTEVLTPEHFSSISTGIIQSCGTSVTGAAFCWGNNTFGQLGVPRPGDHCGESALECSRVPIAVFGQQRFSTIATGLGNHTCGISLDTAILCWGLGSDGQLGDGFTRDRQSLPVAVLAPEP